jgi:transposase
VARVVVSNPQKTRAIAKAKVKTDKVDAAILAELLAANFLLSVWVADEQTHALRRQVARRANIVKQRHPAQEPGAGDPQRNLIPRCPPADLFGVKGRCWLSDQHLPADEELAIDALLRRIDFHAQELRIIDAALGRVALEREEVLHDAVATEDADRGDHDLQNPLRLLRVRSARTAGARRVPAYL